MTRPTVLVLRALGLGDFVTGLPALRVLRETRPDRHIVLALPRWLWPLLDLIDTVDAAVAGHELDPLTDPPIAPELAVDLHGNGPASVALLAAVNPRRIVAYAAGSAEWLPDEHEVEKWCHLLRAGLPAPYAVSPLLGGSLAPPGRNQPGGRTIVHCGAKAVARRWPPDRFAVVAAELARAGHDVVVTGGPADESETEAVATAAGVECRTDLALLDFVDLVAKATLVVSGDTGAAHLAAAYERPSVTLFGPVSPSRWGPPARTRHRVIWHGDGTGDPHAATLDAALARISPDEVLSEAWIAAHASMIDTAHA
ncbi:MAG: glycosyltransferase family 9 protein [Actinobacteria bacterium]|nr:glycosyltransferase family 9 protein [Actinomycetota bacterium]